MSLTLVVQRLIAAPPERLFRAWTQAELLRTWWGPRGVRCTGAEVDARIGGRFRIGNALPDGSELFIVGEYLEVEAPHRLVFTWSTEPPSGAGPERVTVTLKLEGAKTRVVVTHERIADARKRDEHVYGWEGCLEGLATRLP